MISQDRKEITTQGSGLIERVSFIPEFNKGLLHCIFSKLGTFYILPGDIKHLNVIAVVDLPEGFLIAPPNLQTYFCICKTIHSSLSHKDKNYSEHPAELSKKKFFSQVLIKAIVKKNAKYSYCKKFLTYKNMLVYLF